MSERVANLEGATLVQDGKILNFESIFKAHLVRTIIVSFMEVVLENYERDYDLLK